jgi:hypothetical protein
MTRSKMAAIVVGLMVVTASPAMAQARANLVATATVIDVALERSTREAAVALGNRVTATTDHLRQDLGPVTILASNAGEKEAIEETARKAVTVIYW